MGGKVKNRLAPMALVFGVCMGHLNLASAQDARYLAANCANCHGTDGKSTGAMPSLAGTNAEQFVANMKAFKDGTRKATIMHQLAKGYSDEQIATLAQYFSTQK